MMCIVNARKWKPKAVDDHVVGYDHIEYDGSTLAFKLPWYLMSLDFGFAKADFIQAKYKSLAQFQFA